MIACRFLVLFVFVAMLPGLHARIGESKSGLEGRLLNAGGIEYSESEQIKELRRGKPYTKYEEQMPPSAELRIYFKTTGDETPSLTRLRKGRLGPGWDLHVVYVNGQSVLEFYERSEKLSEYEVNLLLALNAGGSFWKRISKGAEDAEEATTAFGCAMIRADEKVRAKRVGRKALLVVDADFDEGLARMYEGSLQEEAPSSVHGF